jgi:hypothetical protein
MTKWLLAFILLPTLVFGGTAIVPITKATTLIDGGSASFAFGSELYCWIANSDGVNWPRSRILMGTDLVDDSLPEWAIISSCNLCFYSSAPQGPVAWDDSVTVYAHAIEWGNKANICGWDGTASGEKADGNVPTWTYRTEDSVWLGGASAGGAGCGIEKVDNYGCADAAILDSVTMHDEENHLFKLDLGVEWAERCQEGYAYQDGVLLITAETGTGSNSTTRTIWSDDAGTMQPYLEIDYLDETVLSCKVDYWQTDYSSELDRFWVGVEVSGLSPNETDSLVVAISRTGYPDSTTNRVIAWPQLTPWASDTIGGVSGLDGDSIYISAWAWDATNDVWSERVTGEMFFDEDIHIITSLASTVSISSGTYVVGGTKVTDPLSGTHSTSISMSGGRLQLDEDTIIWGTDSTYSRGANASAQCISISSNAIVDGGYILHRPDNIVDWIWKDNLPYRIDQFDTAYATYDSVHAWDEDVDVYDGTATNAADSVNDNRIAIVFNNCDNGATLQNIHRVDIMGYADNSSYGGRVIRCEGYGILIDNCRIYNEIYGFKNRCLFDAAAVGVGDSWSGFWASGQPYQVRIQDSYISTLSLFGVLVDGGHGGWENTYIEMYNDSLFMDGRNLRWDDYQGVCYGTANKYLFFMYGDSLGGYIRKCTFLTGDDWNGGRAIGNSDGYARASDPFVIDSCYAETNEGDAQDIGEIYYPCTIKLRGAKNWEITNSQFIFSSDGSVSNGFGGHHAAYYNRGHAIVYQKAGYAVPSPGEEWGITVENNLFRALDISTGADLASASFDACRYYDPTFIWRNNRVETNNIGYLYGYYDHYGEDVGGADIWIEGDTLKVLDGTYQAFRLPNGGGYLATGVVTKNMTYEDANGDPAELDTNIYFGTEFNDADIRHELDLIITVLDAGSSVVSGATLVVRDDYSGGQDIESSTNANGMDTITVTYYHEGNRSFPDSLESGFNNFLVRAELGSHATDSSMTVDWDNRTIILMLDTLLSGSPPSSGRLLKGVKRP